MHTRWIKPNVYITTYAHTYTYRWCINSVSTRCMLWHPGIQIIYTASSLTIFANPFLQASPTIHPPYNTGGVRGRRRTSRCIRPTQSVMYVPLQVNIFHQSILLIVQYKCLKSCSGDFYSPNLILRTRSCVTGCITQSGWVFHFQQTTLVWWEWFVPKLYQFRMGISGGPALKYFCMIHRGGRMET